MLKKLLLAGAPDIEAALESNTPVQASVAQDPYLMAQRAIEVGNDVL